LSCHPVGQCWKPVSPNSSELLERSIAQLKTLSDEEQDAIAARLLAEMEDEQTWKTQFESTTNDQL
jgi:hypothetical protein